MDVENLKRDITRLKSFIRGHIHRGDLFGADERVIAAAESLLAAVQCDDCNSRTNKMRLEIDRLRAESAETHDAMQGLMPELDECWVLSQEGIIAFQRAHGLICQREKTTRAAVLAAVNKQESVQ